MNTNLCIVSAAQEQLDKLKIKLKETDNVDKLIPKINEHTKKLREATRDEKDIVNRMKDRERRRVAVPPTIATTSERQMDETQREYLIRTGKITPFSKLSEDQHKATITEESALALPGSRYAEPISHQNLHAPIHQAEDIKPERQKKRQREEDDEYELSEEEEEDEERKHTVPKLDEIYEDDGNESNYKHRLREWILNRNMMRYRTTHVRV